MFISDADLNLVLTVGLLVHVSVCTRCKASHIYCSFFCMGHCGVTHPDPISTLLCTHLPGSGSCSDCTAGNPIYQPRSVTVPGVRCVCRKVPGVPWLPGEESFQMSDMCEVVGPVLMGQMYLHVIKVRVKCMSSHMHRQF